MSRFMENYSTEFSFNGASYSFDALSASDAGKLETAHANMAVREKEIPKDGGLRNHIIAQCNLIKSYFDDVIEPGAGKAICGEDFILREHYDAYDAFLDFVKKQRDAMRAGKRDIVRMDTRDYRPKNNGRNRHKKRP